MMNRMPFHRAIGAAGLAMTVLLGGGCLFNPPEKPPVTNPPVVYHAYTHPDSLVANFILAWENRDIAEYRDHILYKGSELAPDGNAYQVFMFYFAEDPADPDSDLPDFFIYDEEIETVTKMFSGTPGVSGTPGIREISLALEPFSASWQAPSNPDHVEGDPYPPLTRQRYYSTDMLITLKSEIPGTDINGFVVTDRLWFHVIPVQVGDQVEYRIWKWRDILTD